MTAIRSADYAEREAQLAQDPIVLAMAAGLAQEDREQLAHDSGTPRHEFMGAANREYYERGGTNVGHLGAVAAALLAVLDEEPRLHSFDTAEGRVVSMARFMRYEIQVGTTLTICGTRYRVIGLPEPSEVEATICAQMGKEPLRTAVVELVE